MAGPREAMSLHRAPGRRLDVLARARHTDGEAFQLAGSHSTTSCLHNPAPAVKKVAQVRKMLPSPARPGALAAVRAARRRPRRTPICARRAPSRFLRRSRAPFRHRRRAATPTTKPSRTRRCRRERVVRALTFWGRGPSSARTRRSSDGDLPAPCGWRSGWTGFEPPSSEEETQKAYEKRPSGVGCARGHDPGAQVLRRRGGDSDEATFPEQHEPLSLQDRSTRCRRRWCARWSSASCCRASCSTPSSTRRRAARRRVDRPGARGDAARRPPCRSEGPAPQLRAC